MSDDLSLNSVMDVVVDVHEAKSLKTLVVLTEK